VRTLKLPLNIFIDDRANPSIFDIRAALRLVASNHGQLGMVLVDYLQLMGSDSNSSFRVQELDKESVITSISAIDRVQFTPFVTS
jgi:replicative DNA helicase